MPLLFKVLAAKLLVAGAVVALGSIPAGAAIAADLGGDLIHGQAEFPHKATAWLDLGTSTAPYAGAIANSGGVTLIGYNVGGDRIAFTDVFSGDFVFKTASFDGFTFTDASRNPHIVGIALDPATTVSAASSSDASFTPRSASFNFQGQTWAPGETAVFDLRFGAGGVPEPAAWATMLLGFGLVGIGLRRRVAAVARP